MSKGVCVVVFALVATSVNAADLPTYIKACPANSPDLNKCATNSANAALRGIFKGDENFGIPTFSPFIVPLIEITNNNLVIKLDNVRITGIEDLVVTEMNIDLKQRKFATTIFMDKLNLMGHYIADGKIASLPIKGDGGANITFVGGTYKYSSDFSLRTKNGEEYMRFVNPQLKFQLKRAYFYHGNLFNGNKQLGDHLNNFINENWELFLEEIGVAVEKTIESIASNILKAYARKVPFNKLFP